MNTKSYWECNNSAFSTIRKLPLAAIQACRTVFTMKSRSSLFAHVSEKNGVFLSFPTCFELLETAKQLQRGVLKLTPPLLKGSFSFVQENGPASLSLRCRHPHYTRLGRYFYSSVHRKCLFYDTILCNLQDRLEDIGASLYSTDAFESVNRSNVLLKRVELIRRFAYMKFASHWPGLIPLVAETPFK
jgi:hypothetical protein